MLPVLETFRGVAIFDLQPPDRVAKAKREVAEVIGMRSPARLAEFACDGSKSPEARLLAKCKALEGIEGRQKREFDVEHMVACTIGIERCASRLARLIGRRQAGWWLGARRPQRQTSQPQSGWRVLSK
jgi:hypothetical protein